jgi:tetratricopeptide (TPR) repeat protein
MTSSATAVQNPRLERLLRFLEGDPTNLPLMGDAAVTAYDERQFGLARALIERHEGLAALPPALANLRGMIAITQGDFTGAAAIFAGLRAQGHDNPTLHFNLAWSLAMSDDYQAALDLLDDDAVAASDRGPSLKIQMMHHLGLYREALICGADLVTRYPDNGPLSGALATLALDAEEPALARTYAEAAGDSAEALAVLGILQLTEPGELSTELLDRALSLRPDNARAWVGRGLAMLNAGRAQEAALALDRGAELFGDHLGSWIASGWAYFTQGDRETARARFEHALALDPNFAESHGALAVIEIAAGNIEEARRRTDVALRLDRQCLSGALAKSLLLENDGDSHTAARIRDIALSSPIGPDGQTILQALIGSTRGVPK